MRILPVYDRRHRVPPGARPDFWELRSIHVPDHALDELVGPSFGQLILPPEHGQGVSSVVRLDDPRSVREAYAAVLREARSTTDLDMLNGGLLLAVWPEIWLPARVRDAWETRYPELR